MPTLSDFIQAKTELASRLLRLSLQSGVMARTVTMRVADVIGVAGQNVHAVGIGEKISEGRPTGQRCVRLYVVQKLAESLLPPRDLLPKTIAGLPVDVIETPPAFVQGKKKARARAASARAAFVEPAVAAAATSCTTKRRERQRPMVAGISVGHRAVTAGTIGYFCRSVRPGEDPSRTYLLSNNHVLANVNNATVGDDIYQPGPADGGTLADHVADLHRFVRIQLGGTNSNRVDAAIAQLRNEADASLEICKIGRINGTTPATEGMVVRKHGRTTGYTEGQITDVFYDSIVGMDHLNPSVVALFENQIRIEAAGAFPFIGLPGDSGALVVAKNNLNAVGLYFAGPDTGEYGLANHISDVETELQIRLAF